jgi:hypothetical protein
VRVTAAGLRFEDFHFRSNPQMDTVVTADVRELRIEPRWRALLHGEADVEKVQLTGAQVRLKEGVRHDPDSTGENPQFILRKLEFLDSSFIYEKHELNQVGEIHIGAIDAEVSTFGTSPDWHDQPAHAHATAMLENSGKIDLTINAFLFGTAPKLNVELLLSSFSLKQINGYFHPIDGVLLDGTLLRGHSRVEIKGKTLSGWTELSYRDFDLKFKKNRARSAVTAFFSSIAADLKLKEAQKPTRRRFIKLGRKSRESVVSFILRGMKEAAIRVVSI